MRKMLAVFFSALFLFCLSACGKHNKTEQNTAHSTTDSVATTTVGDITATTTDTEAATTTTDSTTTTTAKETATTTTTTTTKATTTTQATTITTTTATTTTTTTKPTTTTTTKATTTTTKTPVFAEVSQYSWECAKLSDHDLMRWSVNTKENLVGMSGAMKVSVAFPNKADYDNAYRSEPESFFQYNGEEFYAGMGDAADLESITQSGNTVTVKIVGEEGALVLTRESDKTMKVFSNTTTFFEVVVGDVFVAQ